MQLPKGERGVRGAHDRGRLWVCRRRRRKLLVQERRVQVFRAHSALYAVQQQLALRGAQGRQGLERHGGRGGGRHQQRLQVGCHTRGAGLLQHVGAVAQPALYPAALPLAQLQLRQAARAGRVRRQVVAGGMAARRS